MEAKMHIRELKKQPNFNKSILLKFYKETCGFFAAVTSHIVEKSPINYQMVRLTSCMDLVCIANENTVENCTLKFSKLVEKLVYLERITSKVGDDAAEQFMKMISEEVVPKYKDKFLEFNKYEHFLDTFFSQFSLGKCYESLQVFVLIFSLFHGQVAIECGFKTNNDCSVINQSKESLIAFRNAKNVTAANIPITRNLISNVKAARARYFEEIEQKKESRKSK